MSARSSMLAGVLSLSLAGSAVLLSAGTAHAAVDPDDTTFTPVAADLIGVGSDTSQGALFLAANAYNSTSPAPTARLATYAATGGGTIALPSGAVNRPNGSTAGLNLLYGSTNNTDVDYARSSSALNAAQVQAGLQAFPFALDTLKTVVSGSTASHAPASLTVQQIVSIYKGEVTNWSQVGGTAGTIAPKIPQGGSGTRRFFEAQLQAANNGVAVTLAGSVQEVQENDDASIKNNADAIAPFSEGRAKLLGSTLRIEDGFAAKRALYNAVRGSDLGNTAVQSVFGSRGYLCSDAARTLIERAGFFQLARSASDGVCGEATQSATSNFTINGQAQTPTNVTTTTAVSGSSTAPRAVRLTATVTGSQARGTVTFTDTTSGAVVGSATVVGGTATLSLGSVPPGARSYTATFTPASGAAFTTSAGSTSVVVKTTSATTEGFAAKGKAGKTLRGTVTVALAGVPAKATGRVSVTKAGRVVASGTLSAGRATLTLPKLKAGKNTFQAVWAGDANAAGSSVTFAVTAAKKKRR